jgi:hypothetical protein
MRIAALAATDPAAIMHQSAWSRVVGVGDARSAEGAMPRLGGDRQSLIFEIFVPSRDKSPIRPFSPNTNPRIGAAAAIEYFMCIIVLQKNCGFPTPSP